MKNDVYTRNGNHDKKEPSLRRQPLGTRVGADYKIRCLTCGRVVMLSPDELKKRVRSAVPPAKPAAMAEEPEKSERAGSGGVAPSASKTHNGSKKSPVGGE